MTQEPCTCGSPSKANYHVHVIIGRDIFDGDGTETDYADNYYCDEHVPTRQDIERHAAFGDWRVLEFTVTELR